MNVTGETSRAIQGSGRLLDQLVDGELNCQRRQELLAALDREPDGWRRCAIAFLEAQAWADGLRGSEPAAAPVRTAPVRPRAFGFMKYTGVAAAVAVAFLTGFGVRGRASQQHLPSYVLTPPPAAAEAALARPAPPAAPSSALPEYVRRQLEREGYEVKGDQKLVSVALADGRQVAVPVETLKYRFVGYRVH
jgi:hypothetical protein